MITVWMLIYQEEDPDDLTCQVGISDYCFLEATENPRPPKSDWVSGPDAMIFSTEDAANRAKAALESRHDFRWIRVEPREVLS